MGKTALLGAAVALAVCIALLALFAALLSGGLLPETGMKPMAVAACFVGPLLGGLVALRGVRTGRLLPGILSGLLLFLVLMVIALISGRSPVPGEQLLPTLLAEVLGGALSGCLGLKKGRSRGRRPLRT